MSAIIKLKDVHFNNPNLPVISPSLLLGYEEEATSHWLLKTPLASAYQNLVPGGETLSQIGAAATGEADGITFSRAASVDTQYAAGDALTICLVGYRAAGTAALMAGNHSAAGGFLVYQNSADSFQCLFNGSGGNATLAFAAGYVGWFFLGVSITDGVCTLYSPQAPGISSVRSNAGINVPAAPTLGLGGSKYVGNWSLPEAAKLGEAIIFPSALSVSEMAQVYANSKSRVLSQGVAI